MMKEKLRELRLKVLDLYSRFALYVKSDKTVQKYYDKLRTNKSIIMLRLRLHSLHPSLSKDFFKISGWGLSIFLVFMIFYGLFWRAPRPFPEHILISVDKGESLTKIADDFESEHAVISSFWLKVFVVLDGGARKVIAGDYYIPSAKSVFSIASMLTHGDFGLTPIKVSIPEGLNSKEMANLIGQALPRFDKDGFIKIGMDNEGYLFPDTYFLMPNEKPQDAIDLMRENFARKIEPYQSDIDKFQKPLKDDIIMASIIEDEARTIEDKRIIAGILWKRIKMKMPLQVDSTLRYTTGKTSSQLTTKELEDKSNPYNTYANKGLPPTPISNPGIDSIRAAITPTNTKYFYFLSDKSGHMHYAETFEQHKANREAYLGK